MKFQIYSKAYIVAGDFSNNARVWQDFLYLIRRAGLTMLANTKHDFYPQGFSGVVIIGESHIAIHTYPEENKAYVVVATCGDDAKVLVQAFYKVLVKQWQTKKINKL